MKKLRLVLFSIINILLFSFSFAGEYFYSNYEKIPLYISNDEIILKYKNNMDVNKIINIENKEPSLGDKFSLKFAKCGELLCYNLVEKENIRELIDRIETFDYVEFANPVYLINGRDRVFVYDQFTVQFYQHIKREQINELNKKYNVELVKASSASHNLFSLRITSKTGISVVDLANIYHENSIVEYSLPSFIFEEEGLHNLPNDTYFSSQYYLKNTGQDGGVSGADINVEPAWDLTSGSSSITVAIIDAGGSAHEDIPASRIVGGYDYIDDDNDPSAGGNEAHGMACAGIIGATKNNNLGISGIASDCNIMFFRVFDDKGMFNCTDIANAIDSAWQSGADIISNSWGLGNQPNQEISEAINRAMTQGRNGDGAIMVFSAGNNANRNISNFGYVQIPASTQGVIAVGAIDKSNNVQYYSPKGTGTQLTVVAPSGNTGDGSVDDIVELRGDVWSTDIAGQPGWNSGTYGIGSPTSYIKYIWDTPGGDASSIGNYTSHFGGTSAACPQVSGAIALMLSLNPNLTRSNVKYIIERSATAIGSSYNYDYGYGRLNVYNALKRTLEVFGGTLQNNVKLRSNLILEFGSNLTISSNANLELNSFSISKDQSASITIQNGATINPYICLKNGTEIKGLYSNLSDAINAASSGESIEVGSDLEFSTDITVPNGITLKVNSGSELSFDSGKLLKVNSGGNLTANNATFTSTSGTWGGIKYESGSSGSLSNCSISNASYGVYLNGSSRTIEACTINNCTTGIYCKNATSPYLEGNTISGGNKGIYNYYSSPKIVENTISSTTAIYNYHSSPNIADNEITSSGTAIYCENYSSPNVATCEGASASNYCHANSVIYGVFATNNSHPILGATECSGNYGNNSFVYSYCDALAYAKDGCSIYAPHNWWGSASPSSYLFEEDGGSITYLPCLGSLPTYSAPIISPENNMYDMHMMLASSVDDKSIDSGDDLTKYYCDDWSLEQKTDFLRYLYMLGKAKGVATLCKDIIAENPNSLYANFALDLMYQISKNESIEKDYRKTDLSDYLETFKETPDKSQIKAHALLLSAAVNKDISLLNELYLLQKNNYFGKYILQQKFMYFYHDEEDLKSAREVLDLMDEVYDDEIVTYEAHVLMGDDVEKMKVFYARYLGREYIEQVEYVSEDLVENLPETYELSQAYPNPFNPNTSLNYVLPKQSDVKCTIYDLSGNSVKSFDFNQGAGMHSMIWDASHVASGIYIVRFVAEASDGSDIFVDYQKVTLLK